MVSVKCSDRRSKCHFINTRQVHFCCMTPALVWRSPGLCVFGTWKSKGFGNYLEGFGVFEAVSLVENDFSFTELSKC